MAQKIALDFLLDGVREFHSSVGEELDAVVVIRVVRSGDDSAGLKIVLSNQASNAGRCNDAREGHGSTCFAQAAGKNGGDVRARFTGIHTDEDMRAAMLAGQVLAERETCRVKSGVVQRRNAGDT